MSASPLFLRHLSGLALALAWSGLHAADSLDLQRAYALAYRDEPNYLAAKAATEGTRELVPQAFAQFLPNVQLSGTKSRGHTADTNIQSQQQVTSETRFDSYNYSLSVRQPIFRPSSWAGFAQALAKRDGAEADLDNALKSLGQQVVEAYFNLLFAKDILALLKSEEKATEALLAAAIKSFKLGRGTRTDIDEAQANYDMILVQEIEAEQGIIQAKQKLGVLVGMPVKAVASLDAEHFDFILPEPPDLEHWQALAEQKSPALRSLAAALEAAHYEVRKADAAHLPTLDAFYQKSDAQSDSDTTLNHHYNTTRYGLQMTVPIFSGGYNVSLQRQTAAGEEQARQKLEAASRSLSLEVQKQFQTVVQGSERIKALLSARKSSEQMIRSTEKGVQAGMRSRLDILDARRKAAAVEKNLAQTRYEFINAQFRLASLAGEQDEALIERLNRSLIEPGVSNGKPEVLAKKR